MKKFLELTDKFWFNCVFVYGVCIGVPAILALWGLFPMATGIAAMIGLGAFIWWDNKRL